MHIKSWTHYRMQQAFVRISLNRLISRGVYVSDLRGGVWLIVPQCCSPVFSSARFLSDVATGAAAAGGVPPTYLSAELCIVGPSKWEESVRMSPCQPPPHPPNPAFLSLITVDHIHARCSGTLMDRQQESRDCLWIALLSFSFIYELMSGTYFSSELQRMACSISAIWVSMFAT